MSDFGVALFYGASSVMRAEKILQKGGIAVKLIPTPRELSSDCGLAVRFALKEKERVHALLSQAHIELAGIHAM